ncbi:MAG: hypothetical protein ACRDIC_24035 [bacterium]
MEAVRGSFSDRFEADRYAGDEPVRLTVGGHTWDVPERLFARTQHLASAYSLHLLPTLEIYGKTELNGQQAGALAEELAFIRDLVDDVALRPHLDAWISLALSCSRSRPPAVLVVEGP